ncbi:uncharacterized protein YgbK (DUF1537 family) [Lipingzhangella halophila]|uniref:Uncharacterized protein YgbK (DUF1537 family) n=1 Tax=Lipingzhangella halophila TaxID=1783352 RepID=A0A7W7W0X2_9ACTN|nr:four-carbon acid sugar kinase family protein [Lipingzhangella halophila]MBB4930046.1 uncharacterized protein YgbK (DUF1537 family) [Lipingzhangella halophila]
MAQVLVVADDLTGANATGARFARTGMRVATVTPEHVAVVADDYDVVVANLDSRNVPPQQAADLVTDVVEAVWPVSLVVKRVDSTLRGNVGAELDATLRAVRERVPAGTRTRALLVPAFPSSGRVTVDGVQLLDGVPLDRTDLAFDPIWPMATGLVADIVAGQSATELRHVPIRQVTQTMLSAELMTGDEPVVLCDALDERHLEDIAGAAAEAHRKDGTVWVSVDPGPAGALLASALNLRGEAGARGPLLAVAGSHTGLTRRQLDAVARTGPARYVDIDTLRFTDAADDHANAVARELTGHLATASFPEVVILRTVTPAADLEKLSPNARRHLPEHIAELVADVLGEVETTEGAHALPSGLYLTGGDVASAMLDELGVHAFDVGGEVIPMAIYGSLSGGSLDGTPVASKGGLIGDETTALECLGKLRRAAQARLHQVHSEVSEHVVPAAGPNAGWSR